MDTRESKAGDVHAISAGADHGKAFAESLIKPGMTEPPAVTVMRARDRAAVTGTAGSPPATVGCGPPGGAGGADRAPVPGVGAAAGAPAGAPTPPRPQGRYVSIVLAPSLASAARARGATRDALARWKLDHIASDAVAVASELAANAAAAAVPPAGDRPAIIFAIHYLAPEVRLYCWDNGPGKPEPAGAGHDAESGRGLAIIEALTASDWEWWPAPESGGKVVRATLRAPRACWPAPGAHLQWITASL
jgi:anti-sigma regulatory factor (Ser/Thr protein kinase)